MARKNRRNCLFTKLWRTWSSFLNKSGMKKKFTAGAQVGGPCHESVTFIELSIYRHHNSLLDSKFVLFFAWHVKNDNWFSLVIPNSKKFKMHFALLLLQNFDSWSIPFSFSLIDYSWARKQTCNSLVSNVHIILYEREQKKAREHEAWARRNGPGDTWPVPRFLSVRARAYFAFFFVVSLACVWFRSPFAVFADLIFRCSQSKASLI